ncbi:MAG: hypothetical protein Kow0090_03210 [Myxococcota bacterium]
MRDGVRPSRLEFAEGGKDVFNFDDLSRENLFIFTARGLVGDDFFGDFGPDCVELTLIEACAGGEPVDM